MQYPPRQILQKIQTTLSSAQEEEQSQNTLSTAQVRIPPDTQPGVQRNIAEQPLWRDPARARRPEAVLTPPRIRAYHRKSLLSHLGSAHRCATGSQLFPGRPPEPEVIARDSTRSNLSPEGIRFPSGRRQR